MKHFQSRTMSIVGSLCNCKQWWWGFLCNTISNHLYDCKSMVGFSDWVNGAKCKYPHPCHGVTISGHVVCHFEWAFLISFMSVCSVLWCYRFAWERLYPNHQQDDNHDIHFCKRFWETTGIVVLISRFQFLLLETLWSHCILSWKRNLNED